VSYRARYLAPCPPPAGSWTRINSGSEGIRREVAERMGIREGQELRGPVLVTARIKTNALNRDDTK
jgi:hypothetical protein